MKTWTREEIANLLKTNDEMVARSLLQIYNRQTEDEQESEETSHSNGMGFNGLDAPILTSIAKNLLHWGRLTEKQTALVRKKLAKYVGQLTRIANGEG